MRISFKKINFRNNKLESINIKRAEDDIKNCDSENINNESTVRRRRRGAIYSGKTNANERKLINISRNYLRKVNPNLKNFLLNEKKIPKKYYALFFATVILGGLSIYMIFKTNNLFSQEDYQVYKNIDNEIDEEIICTLKNNDGNETNTQDNNLEESNVIQTSAEASLKNTSSTSSSSNTTNTIKIVPLSFSKPLNGEVLKPFSIDKIIYSKTLELWKTHDGIDIKADIGSNVKSIEKGVVEKVYNDSFYGVSVVIDHSQGYKSVYSNLSEDVQVKVGQSVVKGKVIGKVSNSAIGEIKDDPHLHFMLYKNNEVVDPTYIFGL